MNVRTRDFWLPRRDEVQTNDLGNAVAARVRLIVGARRPASDRDGLLGTAPRCCPMPLSYFIAVTVHTEVL
jgi:hypothetical protein